MTRMILLLALPAMALAAPAAAQDGLDAESFDGPNEIECRRIPPPPGTRLGQRNICKTRAEWQQLQRENRNEVMRQQDLSHWSTCDRAAGRC